MEVNLEDLEQYLLEEEEELNVKVDKEKDLTFESLESELDKDDFFESAFTRVFSSGKHFQIDLPSSSFYSLSLQFAPSREVIGYTQVWNSYRPYESNYRVLNLVKQAEKQFQHACEEETQEPLTTEQLEDILNRSVQPLKQTSPKRALEILNSEFDPCDHPLYSLLTQPVQEETKDDFGFVVPNISRAKKMDFAEEDVCSVANFYQQVPNLAIRHNFELDIFQKRAVLRLEQKQNVFVAAHTSAGKTVVAEYAIALAKHSMSRVIYTSPIKALSNQKYREFKDVFKDVGILTGDVSVNSEAFCLIMTTEVLRSMLYNGSSKLRDLEWVVLDEVHFINDKERGVVWEEVLIMLPSHVRIVMLSATVPNYMDFSNWVGRVRQQKVWVQCTRHRPVPLEHSIYINKQFVTVLDASGNLYMDKYKAVKSELKKKEKENQAKSRGASRGKGPRQRSNNERKYKKSEDQLYKELILNLRDKNLLPCVVFAFSRDKVDKRGSKLLGVDLLNDSEKFIIKNFTQRALKKLSEADRNLPQVLQVSSLLESGIGIHHSGILPILKEIVEILFSKGLVKVLVATETFAMGLNMPTRSVVFCELRKFDGKDHRYLQAGEYTQMSGRAGRRGKDDKGNVIMFFRDVNKLPAPLDMQNIIKSEALVLKSKFRIRYNQVCNVLCTEDLNLEELAKKSFLEDENLMSKKNKVESSVIRQKHMYDLKSRLENIDLEELNDYSEKLYGIKEISSQYKTLGKKPSLGGVVEVLPEFGCNCTGVIINKANKVKCLVFAEQKLTQSMIEFSSGYYTVQEISACDILFMYQKPLPKNLQAALKSGNFTKESIDSIYNNSVSTKNSASIVPSKQLFKDKATNFDQRDALITELSTHPLFTNPNRHNAWLQKSQLDRFQNEEKKLQEENQEESSFDQEITSRIEVLKKYNYVNEQLIVQLKGRVLGVVNNPYALVICEALFGGVFRDLEPAELAGVVSVFVTEEKKQVEKDMSEVSENIAVALNKVTDYLTQFLGKEKEFEVKSEFEEDYLRVAMVEVVYRWACGMPFIEIAELTPIREGNIVRGILRVNETLRTIHTAAIILGDHETKQKCLKACELIQRDIVFAASLYLID